MGDLLTYLPQISWLLLIFSSLYYLTAKTFLPRICLILLVRDYETQANSLNISSSKSDMLNPSERILLEKRLAALSNILAQTKFLIMFWCEKFDTLRKPSQKNILLDSEELKYKNSLSFFFRDQISLQIDVSSLLTASTGKQPQATHSQKVQQRTLISDKICK